MAFAIETENLSRRFPKVQALEGLTLGVASGTMFGFLGPNGAGKTTTLRLLLGLDRPDGGQSRVLGLDSLKDGSEIRRRVGVMLEPSGLYDRLTAEENVVLAAKIARLPETRARERTRALLDEFGLEERRKDLVASFSRGMRQKVALARALVTGPEVLFLDEPTSGLDPAAAAEFRSRIQNLARQGTTVFFISHNLHEVERICDQVAILIKGKLVARGPPRMLRSSKSGTEYFVAGAQPTKAQLDKIRKIRDVERAELESGGLRLTLRGAAEVAPITAALVRMGLRFTEVRREGADLEAAYLELAASPLAEAGKT